MAQVTRASRGLVIKDLGIPFRIPGPIRAAMGLIADDLALCFTRMVGARDDDQRWERTMRRHVVLSMFLLLGVCVCACGVGATTGSQTDMSLQVTRVPHGSSTPITFEKTVTDTSAVQRLYGATLALPKGEWASCPTTIKGYVRHDYHLTFHQGTSNLPSMTLQTWGCGYLFIRADDVRRTDVTFMDLFAQTIGVAPTAL